MAYEQTNAMFGFLNAHLIKYLENIGYKAVVSKEALTFQQENLISNWSHRHFAYAAGFGTFRLNNMLITKNGCCGICVKNCPTEALNVLGYERQKCYSLLRENAKIYTK